MEFLIATLVTIAIAFAVIGFIFIPYFYGCRILWLKMKLVWKILLPIIYGLLVWFAIEFDLFEFVLRFTGLID